MKLAAVFMIGSVALFAFSAADAKERDHRRSEGNARERTHVVRDARNRTAVPNHRATPRARDERRDTRAGNGRGERHDNRSERRRDDNPRDAQRIISDRSDRHTSHRREGDIRREERHIIRDRDSHRHDDRRRYETPRHAVQHRIVHEGKKRSVKKYRHHHHGHSIVRREHYVRHNLVSIDNFWDGIFLGAIYHVAYHDGMFCRNRFHDHYRTHYYWKDEFGYCYRVEPGHRRDRFIEVPEYMCY